MNKEYKFGFLHYWNYFKINYIISLKSLFEYKENLYFSFISTTCWNSVFLLLGFVFKDYLSLIGWSFTDYILFLLCLYLIYNTAWLFLDDKILERELLTGNFNQYLFRPGKRFWNYLLKIEFNMFIISLTNILIFVPFILYNWNYTLKYIILSLLIFFFALMLCILALQVINALNFYYKKLAYGFFQLYSDIESTNQTYTPLFFSKSKLYFLIYFFHSFFIALLIIPLFKGIIIQNFIYYFIGLIILNIILYVILQILWHFGLKKYEAYN